MNEHELRRQAKHRLAIVRHAEEVDATEPATTASVGRADKVACNTLIRMTDLASFIREVPKAELHLHIEGTLEPEQMFAFGKRNKVDIPFKSVDEVKAAYAFSNLQDFLDICYQGASVLMTEEDFKDMALA